MRRAGFVAWAAIAACACGGGEGGPDASGGGDAGGGSADAGPGGMDAGARDAGVGMDGGRDDAGPEVPFDAGPLDGRDMLAAGIGHTCLLRADGTLRCWGANGYGQLGYGNIEPIGDDETPREAGLGAVDVGASVRRVVIGDDHTCVVTGAGRVRCWGRALLGRLGYGNEDDLGDDETPASIGDVAIPGVFTDVEAAWGHTCATTGSAVVCWGFGRYGKLGIGGDATIGDDEIPTAFAALTAAGERVDGLGLGDEHSCAIVGGAVRCWGSGAYGQLGYGNRDDIGDDETPASAGDVDLGEATPVIQVAAGYAHTCALLQSGRVRCWGANGSGQLGLGHTIDIGDDEAPGTVDYVDVGDAVTQIAVGYVHTCALLESGAVRCWGQGNTGQHGLGDVFPIGDDETPASRGDVPLGGPATQIAAGYAHTCALMATGAVRCWGGNGNGQLGLGHTQAIGDDEDASAGGEVPL